MLLLYLCFKPFKGAKMEEWLEVVYGMDGNINEEHDESGSCG